MAFIPCNLGGGSSHDKSITLDSHSQVDLGEDHEYRYVTEMAHSATYTLAVGASAAQSQDMGERHNYRYAKWPYQTVTINCNLYLYHKMDYAAGGTTTHQTTKNYGFTITVNIKNKTYSLSGTAASQQTSKTGSQYNGNYNHWSEARVQVSITSVSFT